MTLDVYRGRKTTNQQQQQHLIKVYGVKPMLQLRPCQSQHQADNSSSLYFHKGELKSDNTQPEILNSWPLSFEINNTDFCQLKMIEMVLNGHYKFTLLLSFIHQTSTCIYNK